ncbi:SDR family NAD(P)-dependent oxidoreductase [Clostridium senegalense]
MKSIVLITGATSGIGMEFAKIFAKEGYNLFLVGRNEKVLSNLKKSLIKDFNINVDGLIVDLSKRIEIENLYNYIIKNNYTVEILINNAGLGYNGEFNDISIDKHLQVIDVNIRGLTILTSFIIKDMKIRGEGKILNVASTGAYQPGSFIATYYASKAYVLSFSYALKEELKPYKIIVTALCPGATKTNFSKRAGKSDLSIAMNPYDVAYKGYKGLMKGKGNVIPGATNKIAVFLSKMSPNIVNSKVVANIQYKAYKNYIDKKDN